MDNVAGTEKMGRGKKIFLWFFGVSAFIHFAVPDPSTPDTEEPVSEVSQQLAQDATDPRPEPEPEPEDTSPQIVAAPDITLDEYADLWNRRRQDTLASGITFLEGDPTRFDEYETCMGDYAETKSGDLEFIDVLGWCENERLNSPDRFAAHYNELDAPNLLGYAVTHCHNFMRDQLNIPSSADFAYLTFEERYQGRQTWMIRDRFDAQNGLGMTVPMLGVCTIQHDLEGLPIEAGSWSLIEIEVGTLR